MFSMHDSSRRSVQAHRWLPEESHKHLGGLSSLVLNMRHDSSCWALLHLQWQLFALCCST